MLKAILTVISLCTYIMVASSAYRMILYIRICQLTFLRIIVLWALAVTAFVLAGIIVTIFHPDFRLFRYCMMVVTVFYLVLAFAKPDYWIAGYNIQYVNLKERGGAGGKQLQGFQLSEPSFRRRCTGAGEAGELCLPDGKFHGHAELFQ